MLLKWETINCSVCKTNIEVYIELNVINSKKEKILCLDNSAVKNMPNDRENVCGNIAQQANGPWCCTAERCRSESESRAV